MSFPAVDPIPLPAPVWLMKFLSHVTLALHFSAVMILVGSLVLVIFHNFRGASRSDGDATSTSFTIARRLPVLMTFVINLGVPPLLFAQVLFGRAIYSSSVLIAVMWISVIFLVMLDYWVLYRIVAAIEKGRAGWPLGVGALLVTMGIGQIYSMNMTLMLRPEVWAEMYAKSPQGLQGVHGDPTMMPRWLFVMCGGLIFGGLWAVLLSNMRHIGDAVKASLRRSGGVLAALGVALQLVCAFLVVSKQPDGVVAGIAGSVVHSVSGYAYLGAIALAGVSAILMVRRATSNFWFSVVGLALAFVGTAGAVIYRDGIRDFTLKAKGYDVWDRVEVSNWSVIGLFLLLFVIMLAIIVWLLTVMRRATPPTEQVAP